MPDHFLCHSIAPYGSRATDAAKQFTRINSGCRKPSVQKLLHPFGNGNGSNVPTFSDEIDDRPRIFAPLKVVKSKDQPIHVVADRNRARRQ